MYLKLFVTSSLFAALVSGCGGGGSGESNSDGRYELSISGAQLESTVGSFGQATIKGVDLLLDGDVIATRTFSPAASWGIIGTIVNLRRNGGKHTLEFRITDQTVTSSNYGVNNQGFVLIQDTQNPAYQRVIVLRPGDALSQYTATLSTGQGIKIQFDVP